MANKLFIYIKQYLLLFKILLIINWKFKRMHESSFILL